MKQCSMCGQMKVAAEFSKRSSAADGLQNNCKPCAKAYSRRIYGEKHEERLDYRHRYYIKNADLERGRRRDYYARNEDRERAYRQRDDVREYQRQWREQNPDRWRETLARHSQKRRAVELSAVCGQHPGCKRISRRVVWGRDEGHCRIKLLCDGVFVPFKELHLDHVIPLSKGGLHCYCNLQTGCAPCNMAKGAR